MLDSIKYGLGHHEVTELPNRTISFVGVSAKRISADIKKIWETSRIAAGMFITFSSRRITISSFFALEFAYIIETILNQTTSKTPRKELGDILSGLYGNTWLNNVTRPVKPWLNRKAIKNEIKFTLKPHQEEFLNFYERVKVQYSLNGMLLSSPAGTGKTTMGISVAVGTDAEKVIVISPKNAIYRVWEDTLNNDMVIPQNPSVFDRDRKIDPNNKWHIFHFEALDAALELANAWAKEAHNVCIILDESHSFNELKSARTLKLIELCRLVKARHIIWSSGTPIKALGYEAIPLIKTIDPLFNVRSEEAFKKMYGRDAKRALDILATRMGVLSYTPPKSEIVAGEPEFIPVRVKMPNSKDYTLSHLSLVMRDFIKERTGYYDKLRPGIIIEYRDIMTRYEASLLVGEKDEYKQYQAAVRQLMVSNFSSLEHGELAVFTNRYEKDKIIPWLPEQERANFRHIKSIVKYPMLKVRGEALGKILTRERVQCHIDLLKYVDFKGIINESLKKTIVFTSYVKVVDKAHETLIKQGFKPMVVYGETNHNLPAIVQTFGKDPKINPLIATIQSLSTAVPLIMANTIILLNQPWRSFEKEQAVARIHRLGQDQQTFVYEVTLDTGDEPNISTRSLDILEWSRQQVEMITGIKGDVNIGTESYGYQSVLSGDPNAILDDVLVDGLEPSLLSEVTTPVPDDKAIVDSLERLFDKDGNRED